jgi:hypothetical protein
MKATHSGHCQACGRLQKLPGGKLSKHGYTVRQGFFSGTCPGSGHLPFEVSHDLVSHFIALATASLEEVQETQAKWRVRATEPRTMVRVYIPATWEYRKSRYDWQLRDLEIHRAERYADIFYAGTESRYNRQIQSGSGYWAPDVDILEAATLQNSRYADSLEGEVNRLRRYIDWQRERVRTWKPAPLLSLSAKDDEGFDAETE